MSSNGGIGFEMAFERLHPIDTVQNQPQTTLTHWQLIKVRHSDGNFSRHLAGQAGGEGRASSDIVAMDPISLQATTRSGRIYVLERPGRDDDAQWAFAQWLKVNRCTQHADQTRELLRLRARMRKQALLLPNKLATTYEH